MVNPTPKMATWCRKADHRSSLRDGQWRKRLREGILALIMDQVLWYQSPEKRHSSNRLLVLVQDNIMIITIQLKRERHLFYASHKNTLHPANKCTLRPLKQLINKIFLPKTGGKVKTKNPGNKKTKNHLVSKGSNYVQPVTQTHRSNCNLNQHISWSSHMKISGWCIYLIVLTLTL